MCTTEHAEKFAVPEEKKILVEYFSIYSFLAQKTQEKKFHLCPKAWTMQTLRRSAYILLWTLVIRKYFIHLSWLNSQILINSSIYDFIELNIIWDFLKHSLPFYLFVSSELYAFWPEIATFSLVPVTTFKKCIS